MRATARRGTRDQRSPRGASGDPAAPLRSGGRRRSPCRSSYRSPCRRRRDRGGHGGPALLASAAALLLLLLAPAGGALPAQEEGAAPSRADERAEMVGEVRADMAETARETGRAALDPAVEEAMTAVPRHEFVPDDLARHAYANRPLPIGHGQTISQPYIVALMTDLLDPEPTDRVLEVGTGSGYQAAVLAELVEKVHTIEIIPELGESARQRLERLGHENVEVKVGDGYYGWPEAAPFDAILVAAAASHIPPPLVEQLAPGARMIIPVGGPFSVQQLMLVEKGADGEITTRQVLPVAFVPLTGEH